MVEGYHHVGIYCHDIGESLAFYRDTLGFKHLFSTDAMEGDKPLKMAWVKGWGIVIELLEEPDTSSVGAAGVTHNHIAVRVDDIEALAADLRAAGVEIEAGPLSPPLPFDRPLDPEDADTFVVCGDAGAQLRIMFFRGPAGERFEAVQDNIGAL